MQALISALFDRWADKPILVIGGGPSVNVDLPLLQIEPACVVSANEHGIHQSRFKVDLFVNVDKHHCMQKKPMSRVLRPITQQHGGAIANRHAWADYRMADWHFSGNSGLTAVVLACALGGNPVIVTGIDFWMTGRAYFHDKSKAKVPVTERNPFRRKKLVRQPPKEKAYRKLAGVIQACEGANLRPMSGPLIHVFRKFDAAEKLPERRDTAYRKHLAAIVPVPVQAMKPFHFSNLDPVSPGQLLVLSPKEAAGLISSGKVALYPFAIPRPTYV